MKKNEQVVSAKLFDELYFKYQHEIKRRVVAESNVERLREKIKELKSKENNSVEENNVYTEISKADKMFGDLGYWKKEYLHKIMYYKYCLNLMDFEIIDFYTQKKICEAYTKRRLSNKEHLAIREKMKELGWVDE